MYAYIKDGEVARTGPLPKTWTKKDGKSVSGFNLLPEDEIRAEGWLPLVEDKPEFDPDTLEKPVEETEPGIILENHLFDLDFRVSKMELGL